jgi:hypothetical protein
VSGVWDIPITIRTSVLKNCIMLVLTYGCEVWEMDWTSNVNRLQTILNQCLRRLVGVGAKAPGVATTPLLRELGTSPIEATAATARTRAFLKSHTLDTCKSDMVGQLVVRAQILGHLEPCVGWIVLLGKARN